MSKISLQERKSNFFKPNSKIVSVNLKTFKILNLKNLKSLGLDFSRCIISALQINQIIKHSTKLICNF